MKEFGLYTITQDYIDKFSSLDPHLTAEGKYLFRPTICCIQDDSGQFWVLPVTSLDPQKDNYHRKRNTVEKHFNSEWNEQVKASFILPDITGKRSWKSGYRSILHFYEALPVTQNDVKEYKLKDGTHCIITDPKLQKRIKANFTNYMKNYFNGEYSGFLKHKDNAHEYQFNCKGLLEAIQNEQKKQQNIQLSDEKTVEENDEKPTQKKPEITVPNTTKTTEDTQENSTKETQILTRRSADSNPKKQPNMHDLANATPQEKLIIVKTIAQNNPNFIANTKARMNEITKNNTPTNSKTKLDNQDSKG